MESYSFIESGLVLSIASRSDLFRIPWSAKEFSLHGNAFSFLHEYFDEYSSLPTKELLFEKFGELDKTAINLSLDYCLAEFSKQVLVRKATTLIRDKGQLLKTDPERSIREIVSGLDDLGIEMSEDISQYDSGSIHRLEAYRQRKEIRGKMRMLGIPTPLRTLNRTGIGWLPGDLVSLFARPTVGKTWLTLKAAAIAMKRGHKTLFISPEMPTSSIELRMDVILANMAGYSFSHSALRKGDSIDEAKYEEFLKSNNTKKLLTCDHIEKSSVSLAGIQAKARKHKPDLLIVDGIQLISGTKNNSAWERLQELFYGLKTLATSQKLVCIASTQANRGAADIFSPPGPEHVAFGDALLQASDVAFSMCKSSESDLTRLVQCQKYRDGEVPFWQVTIEWDVDRGKIEEKREEKDA